MCGTANSRTLHIELVVTVLTDVIERMAIGGRWSRGNKGIDPPTLNPPHFHAELCAQIIQQCSRGSHLEHLIYRKTVGRLGL